MIICHGVVPWNYLINENATVKQQPASPNNSTRHIPSGNHVLMPTHSFGFSFLFYVTFTDASIPDTGSLENRRGNHIRPATNGRLGCH